MLAQARKPGRRKRCACARENMPVVAKNSWVAAGQKAMKKKVKGGRPKRITLWTDPPMGEEEAASPPAYKIVRY